MSSVAFGIIMYVFSSFTCIFIDPEETVSFVPYEMICHVSIATRIVISGRHLSNCGLDDVLLYSGVVLSHSEGGGAGVDGGNGHHKPRVGCEDAVGHGYVEDVLVTLLEFLVVPYGYYAWGETWFGFSAKPSFYSNIVEQY